MSHSSPRRLLSSCPCPARTRAARPAIWLTHLQRPDYPDGVTYMRPPRSVRGAASIRVMSRLGGLARDAVGVTVSRSGRALLRHHAGRLGRPDSDDCRGSVGAATSYPGNPTCLRAAVAGAPRAITPPGRSL